MGEVHTGIADTADPMMEPVRRRSRRRQDVEDGPLTLAPLPWPETALAPVISTRTVRVHYHKHHRGYLEKLNELIRDTAMATLSLEEIIRQTAQDKDQVQIFNNAAQVWNHDFYWRSLKPNGGGRPQGEFMKRIEQSFGSFEDMRRQMAKSATSRFGSGWVWLVEDQKELKIMDTGNADNPLTLDARPLMTLDVWEHAYYLDYQNRREDHIKAIIEKLVNWEFAARNLERNLQ